MRVQLTNRAARVLMFNITEWLQKMFDENGEVTSVNAAETIDDGRLNDGTTGIRSLRAGVITAPGGDGGAFSRETVRLINAS